MFICIVSFYMFNSFESSEYVKFNLKLSHHPSECLVHTRPPPPPPPSCFQGARGVGEKGLCTVAV